MTRKPEDLPAGIRLLPSRINGEAGLIADKKGSPRPVKGLGLLFYSDGAMSYASVADAIVASLLLDWKLLPMQSL